MVAAIPALFCCSVLLSVPLLPPFAGTRLVIDHAPVVAPPPTLAPANVKAPGLADWQIVLGPPGVTVAGEFTVIGTVETPGVHGPAPSGSSVVRVRITDPDAMDGVYVEVREFIFEKVPLGADQVELDAPAIVPARVIVPPAQTVCGAPAFAVAPEPTFIVLVLVAAVHGPLPSGSLVVNVSVTVPI